MASINLRLEAEREGMVIALAEKIKREALEAKESKMKTSLTPTR